MRILPFLRATADLDWFTLDDLHAHLTSYGYWSSDQEDLAPQLRHVREMLAMTDSEVRPVFPRLDRPSGQSVWKQESAFTQADYEAVVAYHAKRAAYAYGMVRAITTAIPPG